MKQYHLAVLAGTVSGLLLVGAGCSPSAPATISPNSSGAQSAAPAAAPASSLAVSISNFSFQPGDITVKRGSTITWTNRDSAPHTVTADQNSEPKSGTLNLGDSFSYTFNTLGTFPYYCIFHPSMRGSVTVTE